MKINEEDSSKQKKIGNKKIENLNAKISEFKKKRYEELPPTQKHQKIESDKNKIKVLLLLIFMLVMLGRGVSILKNLIFPPQQEIENDNRPKIYADYNKDYEEDYEQDGQIQKGNISESRFSYSKIPKFNDVDAYYVLNNNKPYFDTKTLSIMENVKSYENYSELDDLGRVGVCESIIGQDLMPKEKRGKIGHIKPSGWKQARYDDIIKDKYLYNRCHLIGFQLTGENDNEKNLMTGTRFFNTVGMLPFENEVTDYIKKTNNHVKYKITPIFIKNELVARGIIIEAFSIEDKGKGVMFNVFIYNNQPKIKINYKDGSSSRI